MGTDEVVGNFTNESDVEAECERVYTWRNWRVSHLEEIKEKLDMMWDEELFALKWLEADDIYQALDLVFIEEKRVQKLSLKTNKGKEVAI